jgi:hypothetical protein
MIEAIDIGRGAAEVEAAMTGAHSWAQRRAVGKNLFESAATF